MSQRQSTYLGALKQQHHRLWLLLGLGFSLWFCSQLAQTGVTSIGLFVCLLVTYYWAGQWAARLIAHSTLRWAPARQNGALMASSLKIGVLFSLLSILFHLVLLSMLADGNSALDILLHAKASVLLRAAIFPFLACLGAACTASGADWAEPAEMVHYPKNSGLTTTPE